MTPTQCLGQEVSRSQKDTGNGVVRPDVSGMPGAGVLSSGSRFRSAGSQSNSRRPRATLIPTRPPGDTFPCPRGRLPVPAGDAFPCPRGAPSRARGGPLPQTTGGTALRARPSPQGSETRPGPPRTFVTFAEMSLLVFFQ